VQKEAAFNLPYGAFAGLFPTGLKNVRPLPQVLQIRLKAGKIIAEQAEK